MPIRCPSCAADHAYERLEKGYAEDMQHARDLKPAAAREHAAVYVLPDASWARRVSGALANGLARAAPARAHAMLSPNSAGGMQVSVRAPLERPAGAAALCLDSRPGAGAKPRPESIICRWTAWTPSLSAS